MRSIVNLGSKFGGSPFWETTMWDFLKLHYPWVNKEDIRRAYGDSGLRKMKKIM